MHSLDHESGNSSATMSDHLSGTPGQPGYQVWVLLEYWNTLPDDSNLDALISKLRELPVSTINLTLQSTREFREMPWICLVFVWTPIVTGAGEKCRK